MEAALCLAVLAFMILVMNLAFLFQRQVGNTGWVDVFWTFATALSCVAVAIYPAPGAPWPSQRQLLVAALVGAWGLRLGLYVAGRVAGSEEDARYRDFRSAWGAAYQRKLFLFLQPQALVTALLALSVVLAAHRPGDEITLQDVAGCLIVLFAIGGEALADRQLAAFKAGRPPKGAICDRGLWAWSRHPNYFFEWLGWVAYPVIAFDPARPVSLLALSAPLVMFVVLRFVSGVPPLEKSMLASRGDRFRAYQARTSVFFPLPPRNA